MKKTALITGASSGIGEQLARIHAKTKGDLVLIARNLEKLTKIKQQLEQQHGVSVLVIQKDLTEKNATNEVYDQIKKEGIIVDYLINNAGFGGIGQFHKRCLDDDVKMIQLNILALTKLTHHFLQDFTKRGSGKILNISSFAGTIPGPFQAVYFATKAYVSSFSNAIYEELKDTTISVTNLMPGATKTPFGEKSGMGKTPIFKNPANAEHVAQKGYEAMIKGKLNVFAGIRFSEKIMLLFLSFIPKKMILKQVGNMQDV